MSFVTVLDKVGADIEKFLKLAVPVAKAIEPGIAIAFPAIAPLYNITVSLVSMAEGAAEAAGATGSGTQKMALVVAAIAPYATQEAQALGISTPTQAQIEAYAQSVVDGLKALGSLTGTPIAPPVTPATVTTVGASQITVTEHK